MSDTPITPALTPEEWRTQLFVGHGGFQAYRDEDNGRELMVNGEWVDDAGARALAAIALHGQPFGFTHEDADALIDDAREWDDRSDIFAGRSAELRRIAAKIRALLPPAE